MEARPHHLTWTLTVIIETSPRVLPLTAVAVHTQAVVQRPVTEADARAVSGNSKVSHLVVKAAPAQLEIEKIVLEINTQLDARVDTNVRFSIDEYSGHFVVRVINSETQEVIRQYPPDEFLALSKHTDSTQGFVSNKHV